MIEERFGVIYSERAISDLLRALSFFYISGTSAAVRSIRAKISAFFTGDMLAEFSRILRSGPAFAAVPMRFSTHTG